MSLPMLSGILCGCVCERGGGEREGREGKEERGEGGGGKREGRRRESKSAYSIHSLFTPTPTTT